MIDDQSSRFTLAELEEASGVPGRTIRYYIANQLVSPALGRGRSRYFTSQHLTELAHVASLRDRRLSIDEIRARMTQDTERKPEEHGETWQRVRLHPGLELSMRSDAPESVRALARELQETAREWFGDERSGNDIEPDVQLDR